MQLHAILKKRLKLEVENVDKNKLREHLRSFNVEYLDEKSQMFTQLLPTR